MDNLVVGGKFTALRNRPEGTFFEVTESGLMWIFNYMDPTADEIASVSEGSPFEIRSTVLNGALWVMVKCGSEEWAEAPYNPHLSKAPQLEPLDGADKGYALMLVMVDATDQTIRHLRLIGLGNRFSRQLAEDIRELQDQPFDSREYDRAIRVTQMIYTTPQLARMARNYWKLR